MKTSIHGSAVSLAEQITPVDPIVCISIAAPLSQFEALRDELGVVDSEEGHDKLYDIFCVLDDAIDACKVSK
jgi:hypothetical protein